MEYDRLENVVVSVVYLGITIKRMAFLALIKIENIKKKKTGRALKAFRRLSPPTSRKKP